jgi:hypothetical protein
MGLVSNLSAAVTKSLGGVSAFQDKGSEAADAGMIGAIVGTLTAAIVSILTIMLLGFVVKFLWNNSMPYMFATARPVSSLWTMYAFMLMIFFVL